MPTNKIFTRLKPESPTMDDRGQRSYSISGMNEDILVKDIAQFCKTINLVEAIMSLHGMAPVPTHQWGSKAIDSIFMSKTLLNEVRGGFLAF